MYMYMYIHITISPYLLPGYSIYYKVADLDELPSFYPPSLRLLQVLMLYRLVIRCSVLECSMLDAECYLVPIRHTRPHGCPFFSLSFLQSSGFSFYYERLQSISMIKVPESLSHSMNHQKKLKNIQSPPL